MVRPPSADWLVKWLWPVSRHTGSGSNRAIDIIKRKLSLMLNGPVTDLCHRVYEYADYAGSCSSLM